MSTLSSAGWNPKIGLEEGIGATVRWYRENIDKLRGD